MEIHGEITGESKVERSRTSCRSFRWFLRYFTTGESVRCKRCAIIYLATPSPLQFLWFPTEELHTCVRMSASQVVVAVSVTLVVTSWVSLGWQCLLYICVYSVETNHPLVYFIVRGYLISHKSLPLTAQRTQKKDKDTKDKLHINSH